MYIIPFSHLLDMKEIIYLNLFPFTSFPILRVHELVFS